MKIALNATAFLPGKMGGMETYFRNLLLSLQEMDEKHLYSVLCDRHYIDELPITRPAFSPVPCNFSRPSLGWFLRGVLKNTIKVDILRPFMSRLQVDVIHHPFSMLMPLHCTIPSVLTFHDMQHEFFPEFFSPYEMKVRKEFYRPSAEEATRIIAISEHAKSCLVERYAIAPEKIDVVHNGYNPHFCAIKDQERLAGIQQRHGLHKPFIYYPAATWPHKNHKRLLAAVKILKQTGQFDGQLVLTGISMQASSEILDEIGRLGLREDVRILGYLPVEDLPCLYNLARLMVFPSLFEGFGLPLVEAMACGCPVVCSNVTSIPEVVGDAGIVFDPLSVEDMAEVIGRVWNDDGLRQELAAKGLARAGMFSWSRAARQTIAVYEKAAGSNRE